MILALRDYCFRDERVTDVLVDPMAANTKPHRFYRRLGFQPLEIHMFGPDECLIHRLTKKEFENIL